MNMAKYKGILLEKIIPTASRSMLYDIWYILPRKGMFPSNDQALENTTWSAYYAREQQLDEHDARMKQKYTIDD